MARKRKRAQRNDTATLLLCVRNALLGSILTAALVLLFAISMKWEVFSVDAIDTVNTILKAIAACFVGVLTARTPMTRGWIWAGASGTLCLAISFAVFAVLNGGFAFGMHTLYDALMAFACAACACILYGMLPIGAARKQKAAAPQKRATP